MEFDVINDIDRTKLVKGLAESLADLNKKNKESDTYIFDTELTPTDVSG